MTEATNGAHNRNECIFCQIVDGAVDSWRVYESDSAYAFFDIHPVNEFHTLVTTKRHYRDIFDAPEHELLAVMSAIKKTLDMYRGCLGMNDVQILCASGAQAQQTAFHLHFHIVPRHQGDGQDIQWKTHDALVERFEELTARIPGAGLRKARPANPPVAFE